MFPVLCFTFASSSSHRSNYDDVVTATLKAKNNYLESKVGILSSYGIKVYRKTVI